MLLSPVAFGGFAEMLKRQLDEEITHVRLYYKLVGSLQLKQTPFRGQMTQLVNSLPSLTLKLFALQGLLEGLALGALRYRLAMIENSPSAPVDSRAMQEELAHTRFAFPHFRHLVQCEGAHTWDQFQMVSRLSAQVFEGCFNGRRIADAYQKYFGVNDLDAKIIENSRAMTVSRRLLLRSIQASKSEFLQKYFAAAQASRPVYMC